jgi:hypothetical protein
MASKRVNLKRFVGLAFKFGTIEEVFEEVNTQALSRSKAGSGDRPAHSNEWVEQRERREVELRDD